MPKYFCWIIGSGFALSLAMGTVYGTESGVAIAVVMFCVGFFWQVMHTLEKCPKPCRGHFFAALAWTIILASATGVFLAFPHTKNLPLCLALLVAGVVWIPSWQRLRERWQQQNAAYKPRPLFARLLMQTLWGPLALGSLVLAIHLGRQSAFENAVAQRNLSTAITMRNWGLGDVNTTVIQDGFQGAIGDHDSSMVSFYLDIGTSSYLYNGSGGEDSWKDILYYAAIEDDPLITEMILDHGVSPNRIIPDYEKSLLACVYEMSDRPEIIRILKKHGAESYVATDSTVMPR